MAKTTTRTSDKLKRLMWDRLSESPEKLELDRRADEEPEDLFVRLCNTGRKREVVSALKSNLCDIIVEMKKKEKQAVLRFMQRAIRLCDIIDAYECKPALKLILLDESGTIWGKDFEELKELAARALDGMPKDASEFEYWSHLAEKRNAILPYALNAIIEISLDRGIQKLVQIYFDLPKTVREGIVKWEVILQIAADTHGLENLGDAIDKAFDQNPLAFEFFVHRVARIPSLSKIGERSIEDVTSYAVRPVFESKPIVRRESELSTWEYLQTQIARIEEMESSLEERLQESYGKLTQQQDLVQDYRWKYYPPKAGS